MPQLKLRERLPDIFPLYDSATDIYHYFEALQDELDTLDTTFADLKDALQVDNAEGEELDQFGLEFGLLGRRRGRNDATYQAFLQSLVPGFQGVGTVPDVKFAVAAGLAVDSADVDILEDFANNEYNVALYDWTAHATDVVPDMADLADPVAVPLVGPIEYHVNDGQMVGNGLDVTSTITDYGLSSQQLGDLSSGSWNLSDATS